MPTTYSSNLKITLIGDGEQTNVWGGTTNTNLGTLLEQAITGVSGVGAGNTAITMTGSADYVLTNNDGAVNQARNAVLVVNGASSGGYAVVTPAGQQKVYIVNNKLTTGAVIVKPSGGTGVSVPNATTMILYTDGTTTQAVNYAPPASTATNLAGGTANAIPYQSGPDSTTFLSSVSGDAGKVLTSNGTSAPSWTTVSGGGGTANAIVGGSAGQVLYQSGTSATNFTSIGSSGALLQANSTSPPTWTTNLSLTSAAFSGAVSASTYYVGNASNYINQTSNEVFVIAGGTTSAKFATNGIGTSNIVATGGIGCGNAFYGNYNLTVKGQPFQSAAYVENGSGGQGIAVLASGSGTINAMAFYYNNVAVGVGIIAVTSGGTSYNTSSDRRLKSNIADLKDVGATIDALQPRTYTWNSTKESAKGFIADELQKVIPSAVHGKPGAVDKDGKPEYQMLDASTPEMIALLVCELQSLRKRVAALEAK